MLGIGLGMQLMAELSREGGNIPCLGIFPFVAEKFDGKDMMIPFTGFSQVEITRSGGLFKGIDQNEKFYFSNSYFLPINELTTSVAENKIKFSASIENGNYYAVQFHPEKSGEAGLQLIKNFIEL
jgi:imidazole glycerol-phosphate synthase subunit HisH